MSIVPLLFISVGCSGGRGVPPGPSRCSCAAASAVMCTAPGRPDCSIRAAAACNSTFPGYAPPRQSHTAINFSLAPSGATALSAQLPNEVTENGGQKRRPETAARNGGQKRRPETRRAPPLGRGRRPWSAAHRPATPENGGAVFLVRLRKRSRNPELDKRIQDTAR